jgi:hypothetical protein
MGYIDCDTHVNTATAQGTAPLAPTATLSSPQSLTVPTITAPPRDSLQ